MSRVGSSLDTRLKRGSIRKIVLSQLFESKEAGLFFYPYNFNPAF